MERCSIPLHKGLDPQEREFYVKVLKLLNDSGIPYLIGGAYAFACYTGIVRHTKDFDIFVRPDHAEPILRKLAQAGYKTELTFPHWLGKAYNGHNFIDVIFGSGNGVCLVDNLWFEHAVKHEIMEIPVQLCPPEEMIWSKSLIMERERYDGADIAHILRAQADQMDWRRMLVRMGKFWRVLFSHLILFGFIYPTDRHKVPNWVLEELMERLRCEMLAPPPAQKICQGTLISREQYLPDITEWGYEDGRIHHQTMSRTEIADWTAAIEDQEQ